LRLLRSLKIVRSSLLVVALLSVLRLRVLRLPVLRLPVLRLTVLRLAVLGLTILGLAILGRRAYCANAGVRASAPAIARMRFAGFITCYLGIRRARSQPNITT